MDNPTKVSAGRRHQRAILAAIDAQVQLSQLEAQVQQLREHFRQWCREAELGLRMMLDAPRLT